LAPDLDKLKLVGHQTEPLSPDELTSLFGFPLAQVLDRHQVPRDLVLSRISARRVCVDCGTNYVASGIERTPWICDNCGGDVMLRDDDTPEAVTRRLDLYEEQTAPLIAWYLERDMLVTIDGLGSPDDVFHRMVRAIDTRRHH